MNNDYTLSFVSSIDSSDSSYRTLVEMISDLDLELMDVCLG